MREFPRSLRDVDQNDPHRGRVAAGSATAARNNTVAFHIPELSEQDKDTVHLVDPMAPLVDAATGAGAPYSGPSPSDVNGGF